MAATGALQAVILAGGEGTRLRPLTLARAKPVVPILNRPFLAYQLALLRAHGLVNVSSDPLLDLVAAQEQRMVDEGRERRTRQRYVVWGDVAR